MPTASLRQYPPFINADIFTNSHRFSAKIPLYNRALGDSLNDRLTDYLEARQVYVSRINRPGEIVGTYKLVSLIKRHITFVMLSVESEGLSQEHKYNAFSKSNEEVFITLPSFEITGRFQIIGKFDLKAILTVGSNKFMPIFKAKAVNAKYPEVNFEAPVILVNKEAMALFSVIGQG